MLFLLFNSVEKKYRHDIKGKTFDVGPTILAALGVRHDYLFPVGENLYGMPSETRLKDDEDQERLLSSYIFLKSQHPAVLPCDLRLQSTPYPLLSAGKTILPLRNNGIVDFPSENEFLYLPFYANHKLLCNSFRSCSGLLSFENTTRFFTEYLFITSNTPETAEKYRLPNKKGYLLGLCLNGKMLVKYASPGSMPQISAQEIKCMLK